MTKKNSTVSYKKNAINAERGKKMIDTNALKGIITSRGITQQDVAKHLGITPKTFYLRMKNGVFGSDEIEAMIDFLSITNPLDIFFAEKVTSQVTR